MVSCSKDKMESALAYEQGMGTDIFPGKPVRDLNHLNFWTT